MQNPIVSLALCLAFALASQVALSDTVTLKTGEKLEGKIIAQTDTEVTIQVKVSASISDRKTIPKEEISDIKTTTPDAAAYKELERFALEDNSLTLESYDLIITKKIKVFLKKFPDSPHRADVETTLAAFEEEKGRVEAGEFKLDGKWLSAGEVVEQQYELDAILAYRKIRDLATRGDLVGALNSWEAYNKNFQGAMNFPDTVLLARRIVKALGKDLTRKKAQHERDAEKWERGYELARMDDKEPLKAARDAEQQRYASTIAESKTAGTVWVPLIVGSEASLTSLAQSCTNASRTLLQVNIPNIKSSIGKVTQAKTSIDRESFDDASELLREATTLWPQNAEAKRLSQDMTAMKAASLAAKTAALEAEAAAQEAEQQAKDKATVAAAEVAAEASTASAETGASSKKPFYKTIPGAFAILIVLVAVIGGLSKLGKPKSRNEE